MMSSRLLLITLVTVLAGPVLAQPPLPADGEARVIVRFKPQAGSVRAKAMGANASRAEAHEVAQARATALGGRAGRVLTAGRSLDERTHVVTARGLSAAQLAQQLAADPEVELAMVDQRRKHLALPNDPLFGGESPSAETSSPGMQDRVIDQWYLKKPGGALNPAVVSSINAPAAWDITPGSSGVVIAVLDTGVRLDHPDLAGQFVSGYDLIGFDSPASIATAIANDGNGADADPSDPGDWVTSAEVAAGTLGSSCTSDDVAGSSWHGTRVSGLLAAVANNGLGMAGVGRFKLLPVRVLGKCGGYDSDIIAGMKWAAGIATPGLPTNVNKAKVLNLSLGGSGSCSALYAEAIAQVNAAGAVVVVAAGNSEGMAVGAPGNCANVITVAALRHVGTRAGFSSVGTDVSIAAPGGNCVNAGTSQPCLYPMVSTTNSGATTPVAADDAYTGSKPSVGTSFATPIVSGIVGLMASVRPGLTAAEAADILKRTARPFPSSGEPGLLQCQAPSSVAQGECYCTTSTCGAGMADAAAAVAKALELSGGALLLTESPARGLQSGQTLTLTASAIGLPSNRAIVSTAWVVVAGGGIVGSFASSNTTSATIVPTGGGTFTVRADATDNLGTVYHQTATVNVTAPAPTSGTTTETASSGGGGGAVSAAWLAWLTLAALGLPRQRTGRSAGRR